MLYVLPLEPLEERYANQWRKWFQTRMDERNIDYSFIDGDSTGDNVEVGTVLDAAGTNFWKMTQIGRVSWLFKRKVIKDGDKFFTFDMWHPGLECISYMAQLYGIKVEVYAFLHAGSYTTGDFAAPMTLWARHFERGWAAICKKVFVGSEYHKRKFTNTRFFASRAKHDVVVTGNPFNTHKVLNNWARWTRVTGAATYPMKGVEQRENIIIFPHRWDAEKNPLKFLRIIEKLWQLRKDFRVVITTSRQEMRSNDPSLLTALHDAVASGVYGTGPNIVISSGISKNAYYNELAKAKVFVSTTIEENFGYCLLEAMTFGCHPVVENNYSHPEILGVSGFNPYLYDVEIAAVRMLSNALDNPASCSTLRYNSSVDYILDEMGYSS